MATNTTPRKAFKREKNLATTAFPTTNTVVDLDTLRASDEYIVIENPANYVQMMPIFSGAGTTADIRIFQARPAQGGTHQLTEVTATAAGAAIAPGTAVGVNLPNTPVALGEFYADPAALPSSTTVNLGSSELGKWLAGDTPSLYMDAFGCDAIVVIADVAGGGYVSLLSSSV